MIQERINELDRMLSRTVTNPEWFADPQASQQWLEEEIMQLEAEQLAEIEQEKSSRIAVRPLVTKNNLIIPSIPAWGLGRKGGF